MCLEKVTEDEMKLGKLEKDSLIVISSFIYCLVSALLVDLHLQFTSNSNVAICLQNPCFISCL